MTPKDLKQLQIINNKILNILDKYESVYEAISNEELECLYKKRKKIINKYV